MEEDERNKVPTITTTMCNVCREQRRDRERESALTARESAQESKSATSICHAVKCVNENSNNANVNVDVDAKAKRCQL